MQKKTNKSSKEKTATKGNRKNDVISRTKKIEDTSFLSHHLEIDKYLGNFKKDKKYLLLQGGTERQHEIILEYVLEKISEKQLLNQYKFVYDWGMIPAYDFYSYRRVDCLNTNDGEILNTLYEDVDEDLEHIQKMLSNISSYVIEMMEVKQEELYNNFNFANAIFTNIVKEMNLKFGLGMIDHFGMKYKIIKGRNIKNGDFTVKGILNIVCVIRDTFISEPTISGTSMLNILMRKYHEGHFEKLRIFQLMDVSRENKFGLGPKEIRPDFVFATLKNGENVEYLSQTFRNRKLFEFISLDSRKTVDMSAKEVVTSEEGMVKKAGGKEITRFPTPPNSTWTDVKMGIDCSSKIVMTSVNGKSKSHTFSQVGLSHGNAKVDKITDLLRRLIGFASAENNVIYTGKLSKSAYDKIKSDQKRLNKLFRIYFETIEGPPITCTKGEGFKVQFGKLHLIHNDYDRSPEIATSELSDVPDPNLINDENLNSY